MHKKTLLPILLVASLGLAGCAEETPAAVKSEGSATIIDEPGADVATEGVSEVEQDEAPTQQTAELGDTVGVGDWDVKVTEVNLSADQVIKTANQFNDPAEGVYVLVTFEATYNGSERRAGTGDLSWSLTDSEARIHDPSWEVTPADSEDWPSAARAGGTVKQQVLFDVPKGKVKGGLLGVEAYDADFNSVFADFQL